MTEPLEPLEPHGHDWPISMLGYDGSDLGESDYRPTQNRIAWTEPDGDGIRTDAADIAGTYFLPPKSTLGESIYHTPSGDDVDRHIVDGQWHKTPYGMDGPDVVGA